MSEISLFKQAGLAIPTYLQGELDASTKALMGGTSSKRISIRGGVFRMMVGGKEIAQNTDRSMNIIVVRAAETNSRVFYKDQYDAKVAKAPPPTCWSDDDKVPHKEVAAPQSASCAMCPKNIKGSGQNAESRACRYNRRLAVVLENDMQGDIYALTLPAASIFGDDTRKMGMQQYAKFLGNHGVNVNAVVTEMRFDTDSESPKLQFSAVRPLELIEYKKVVSYRDHEDALKAVTMTVAQIDGVAPAAPAKPPVETAPAQPGMTPTLAPAAAKPLHKATPKAAFTVSKNGGAADDAEIPEPTLRQSATYQSEQVESNVAAILKDWGTDD